MENKNIEVAAAPVGTVRKFVSEQYLTNYKTSTLDTAYAAKSHGTHVTWATATPKVAGTANVGSSTKVAREDHVHPLQTTVSGNAGTATKLATARSLTIGNTGKAFDGSGNVSWSLSEIGAAAASHGNHVPAVQTADARKFLRNDNSWQSLPTASTSATGIVQLNDAVNSTSTAQAATANAVKKAYDRAEQAFQSANNGKTSIATAIGSPLSSSDTFSAMVTKINTMTTNLATNLTKVGIEVSSSEKMATLINKVGEVKVQKLPIIYRNIWTSASSMIQSRESFGCSTIGNKIYVVGGLSEGYGLNTCEVYDPEKNFWSSNVAKLPQANYYNTCSTVNNILYSIGTGMGTANVYAYDPSTNTWTNKIAMSSGRGSATSSVINNKIYVIGGGSYSALNRNDCYDPITNTWSSLTNIPTARYKHAADVVNNKIYCVFGYNGSTSTHIESNECYDPITNTWSDKARSNYIGYDVGSTVVDNKMYIIGGWWGEATFYNRSYDPSTNTWDNALARYPFSVRGVKAASVGGCIFSIGGSSSGSSEDTAKNVYGYIPK